MEETYNGYTNWDTWDLMLWLSNEEKIYHYVKDNLTYMLNMEDRNFLTLCLNLTHNPDGVDPKKVNVTEMKEMLREWE